MPRWLALPPKVADVWDMSSLVLEGHTGNILGTTFSACEGYLATCASADDNLCVWDSATGDCTLRIPQFKSMEPVATSFSRDTKYIAAVYCKHFYLKGDFPMCAVIYEMKTGNLIDTYVCTGVRLPRNLNIRVAFAPGASNALFIAILRRGCLEMWCTNLGSRMIERAWFTQIPTHLKNHFTISANESLVSYFSPSDRSITSWRLECGTYVSSHSIERNNNHFWGFIDCRGRDLVYQTSGEANSTDGEVLPSRPSVQRLNLQTGQVDVITYVEKQWRRQAIALKTGLIAYTTNYSGVVVYITNLLQCPKTLNLTSHLGSSVIRVLISQNEEMILLAYQDHVELRDVLGSIVFRSPRFNLPTDRESVSVSGDGSVVTARLDNETHVFLVKSGIGLQLPDMDPWLCLPVVSGDGRSIAFSLRPPSEWSARYGKNVGLKGAKVYRILLWNLENNQEVKVVDRSHPSWSGAWILFSEDDKTLHTDQGDLDLETGDWETTSLHAPIKSKRYISGGHPWLQLNGEDMLWLPGSYRPGLIESDYIRKNTIAYACKNGMVMIMRWADPSE